MAETTNTTVVIDGDIALQAKEKREFLFNFYDNMMKGGDILSVEDIDIVMESLKLAQLDIKEREKRKILEREARAATQQLETSMSCLSAVKASLISEGIAEKMGKEQSVERTSKTPTRRIASGVDTKKAKTTTKSSIRKKNKKNETSRMVLLAVDKKRLRPMFSMTIIQFRNVIDG